MGSKKLNLRNAPYSFEQSISRFFNTAFGPSPSLYRRVSLCGWRPLLDFPDRKAYPPKSNSTEAVKSPGISVYETPDRMTIEVALTVIKEESLHLAVSNKKLIIRGERISTKHGNRSFAIQGDRASWFQQLIPLPESVSTRGFRAQLKGDIVQIEFVKQ